MQEKMKIKQHFHIIIGVFLSLVLFALLGSNEALLNSTTLPITLSLSPTGTSLQLYYPTPTNRGNMHSHFSCLYLIDFTPYSLGESSYCVWQDDTNLVVYFGANTDILPGVPFILLGDRVSVLGKDGDYYSETSLVVPSVINVFNPSITLLTPTTVGPCTPLYVNSQCPTGTSGRPVFYRWSVEATPSNPPNFSSLVDFLYTKSGDDDYHQSYGSTSFYIPSEYLYPNYTYTLTINGTNWLSNSNSATRSFYVSPYSLPTIVILNTLIRSDGISIKKPAMSSAWGTVYSANNGITQVGVTTKTMFDNCDQTSSQPPLIYQWYRKLENSNDAFTPLPYTTSTIQLFGSDPTLVAGQSYVYMVSVSLEDDPALNSTDSIVVTVSQSAPIVSVSNVYSVVSMSDYVYFSAATSIDPAANSEPLLFEWTYNCAIISESSSINVSATNFDFGMNVIFLNVSSQFSGLTSSIKVIVEVRSDSVPPLLNVGSVNGQGAALCSEDSSGFLSCDSIDGIGAPLSQGLVIHGYITPRFWGETVRFEWMLRSGDLDGVEQMVNITNSDTVKVVSTPTTTDLVISVGGLVAGQNYIFQLTATSSVYNTNSSILVPFSTAVPPSAGILTVSPTTGDSLYTNFTLTTTPWGMGVDGDWASTYTFYYTFESQNSTLYVLSSGVLSSITAVLPAPSNSLCVDNVSKVTFSVGVYTLWGGYSVSSADVFVNCTVRDDTRDTLWRMINTTIPQALYSGDYNTAVQIMSAIAKTLITFSQRSDRSPYIAMIRTLLLTTFLESNFQVSNLDMLLQQIDLICQLMYVPEEIPDNMHLEVLGSLSSLLFQSMNFTSSGSKVISSDYYTKILTMVSDLFLNSTNPTKFDSLSQSTDALSLAMAKSLTSQMVCGEPSIITTSRFIQLYTRCDCRSSMAIFDPTFTLPSLSSISNKRSTTRDLDSSFTLPNGLLDFLINGNGGGLMGGNTIDGNNAIYVNTAFYVQSFPANFSRALTDSIYGYWNSSSSNNNNSNNNNNNNNTQSNNGTVWNKFQQRDSDSDSDCDSDDDDDDDDDDENYPIFLTYKQTLKFTDGYGNELTVKNLSSPIFITLPLSGSLPQSVLNGDKNTSAMCVFWDVVHSAWNTEGCELVSVNSQSVTCGCNHLTTFAVVSNPLDKILNGIEAPFKNKPDIAVITVVSFVVMVVVVAIVTGTVRIVLQRSGIYSKGNIEMNAINSKLNSEVKLIDYKEEDPKKNKAYNLDINEIKEREILHHQQQNAHSSSEMSEREKNMPSLSPSTIQVHTSITHRNSPQDQQDSTQTTHTLNININNIDNSNNNNNNNIDNSNNSSINDNSKVDSQNPSLNADQTNNNPTNKPNIPPLALNLVLAKPQSPQKEEGTSSSEMWGTSELNKRLQQMKVKAAPPFQATDT